jgi:hypothetical protein
MDLGIILATLKFTGIGLSLAFGILALLTKYRDSDGRITRWGRIALVGVFASGLVSAGAQSVELARSNEARRDAERRTLAELEANNRVLNEINRGLNPLSDVRAGFWLSVPLDQPELQSFVQRFTQSVEPLVAGSNTDPLSGSELGAYPVERDMNGKLLTVAVASNSPLFPQKDTERFAYTVFRSSEITMYFYREPIEIESFIKFGFLNPNHVSPDITMSFERNYDDPSNIILEYGIKDKKFRVFYASHRSNSQYWGSSGRILSLLDLPSSQVFIIARHSMVSFEELDKTVHPEILSVVLDVGSRQGLWFRAANLVAHKDPFDGEAIYEYRFPDSLEAIIADLR